MVPGSVSYVPALEHLCTRFKQLPRLILRDSRYLAGFDTVAGREQGSAGWGNWEGLQVNPSSLALRKNSAEFFKLSWHAENSS